jgi:predicted small lipoprotein YifL
MTLPSPRAAARLVAALALAAALAGGVAACGKKPGSLPPPPDAEDVGYPRTYPAT